MGLPSFFPRLRASISNVDDELRKVGFPLLSEFKPVHIFSIIGILVVLYIVERAIDFVFFHFTSRRGLFMQGYKRRGPKPTYALVTGASAGIGFGIAKALVKQGFGVIILGHKEDELAEAATELRAALVLDEDAQEDVDQGKVNKDEYVKMIVMNAITATPDEMEETLRTAIVDAELRVSILVNNVGSLPITLPALRALATYSPDDIDKTIAMNSRFPARLTTLMLPVIAHRGSGVDEKGYSFGTHRRSLILNVGSQGMIGSPHLIVYGATKAFNWSFSRGLARELALDPSTQHIDVLGIIPGNTRSQGNVLGLSRWAPDSEYLGQCIVAKSEKALGRGWRDLSPYWLHHLEDIMGGLVSEKMITHGITTMLNKKKDQGALQEKSKGD